MRTFMSLLTLTALVIFCVGAAEPNDPTPDLTGNWALNEDESDSFKAQGRSQGSPPSGGGGRGGGGRRGGGGGKGGGSRGGGQQEGPSAEDQARMEQMNRSISRLTIFQQGLEMNVTNGLDISRMLITDGRDLKIWTQQGMADATATWSGATLVVRWSVEGGDLEQVQRYSLGEDGTQLLVTATMQRPDSDKTRTMTLVYDRED